MRLVYGKSVRPGRMGIVACYFNGDDMDVLLEKALRRQIDALQQKVSAYERLLHHHEPVWEMLKYSDDSYRVIFENTGTGAFVKEADMTISKVNSEFERLTGYTKAAIEGRMKWTDFFQEADHERLIRYHANRRSGTQDAPRQLECRVRDSQGLLKPVYLTLDLIPETGQSIGTFMDISELKQAEAQLSDSKAFLAAIVDSVDALIYVVSDDFSLQYMNAELNAIAGAAAIGKPCYAALHRRSTVCPFCVHDQILAGDKASFEIINPKDKRWYSSVNVPIHQADGSVSMLAMITDIHARKINEHQLQENERRLRQQNTLLRSTISERSKFGSLVGKSAVMQAVYAQIVSAAATDATVIIYGEPGTGKELVAHAIHDMSLRHRQRFVPVHCGAIPENLIESEFFGYVQGAFSGATADRQGYVDFADKGTLFMDEIGEISPHMQVKLLRVIEGGGYTPVGSNQEKFVDMRIIAATNRDMQERMKSRMMRKDFFYRIHILPIYLPPLKKRKDDLPLLVDHFMRIYGGKKNLPPIGAREMDMLVAHDWPGNVRELQNVIIRYCYSGKIALMGSADSPFETTIAEDPLVATADGTLREQIDAVEKKIVVRALETHRWHRSKVARILGIDRKTLFTKMKRHGLTG